MKSPFDYAQHYVNRGFAVLPIYGCGPAGCACKKNGCKSIAKHPRTVNGVKEATKDLRIIENWRSKFGPSNLGIATGAISGCWVLDIDAKSGGLESLVELEKEYGELPITPRVRTGGGGMHYYFCHRGGTMRNQVGLRAGIDVRGDGGFVVAPPSRHASLKNYKWEEGFADTEVPMAEAPQWLLHLMKLSPLRPETSFSEKLASRSVVFKEIVEGRRNDVLTSIFGHIVARNVDAELAVELINSFNKTNVVPPLAPEELGGIVQSVFKMELQKREGGF